MSREGVAELGRVAIWSPCGGGALSWSTNAAPGSSIELQEIGEPERRELRLDYDLGGRAAWVIARREIAAAMPPHYAAVLRIRAETEIDQLQLKLVDSNGRNVWWWRLGPIPASPNAQTLVLRKAALAFAWGPLGGGDPTEIGAVELALAGDSPASGLLAIEAITIEAKPPSDDVAIVAVTASSRRRGHDEVSVLRPDRSTWCVEANDSSPELVCDFGAVTEWGGVVVEFEERSVPVRLAASDDGLSWRDVASATARDAESLWLRGEDAEARYAKLVFEPGSAPVLRRVEVCPLDFVLAPVRFVSRAAERSMRGDYPRHLLGEQTTWALVAAEGDGHKALLSHDGALEVDTESFTIEPFLRIDGRFVSWDDVETEPSLRDGDLPMPSTKWRAGDVTLDVTAFAAGRPPATDLVVRYVLETTAPLSRSLELHLAIRPFQVTPRWQSLGLKPALAPVHRIRIDDDSVNVDERWRIYPTPVSSRCGAMAGARLVAQLRAGNVPSARTTADPRGLAEAVLCYETTLRAGVPFGVDLAIPFGSDGGLVSLRERGAAAVRERETARWWRDRVGDLPIELPESALGFMQTLRASIGWILANRVGPRIQPGPRCYRRSWVRDGVITATALAEMGFPDVLDEFLRWYAPHQLSDGRVPCAVDDGGVDVVEEHDSHGQLVMGIVDAFRLTGDEVSLRALWPHAERAVGAIERLVAERLHGEHRSTATYGLLPESISHEGYSSQPVHSYWDDFFAIRGLGDAAEAARILGETAMSEKCTVLQIELRRNVIASVESTMARNGLEVLPGSVELGDFDPTSSAGGFDPCDEAWWLPREAVEQTFERYWKEFRARVEGKSTADAYTPYEVRNASALVMLGARARANDLLTWFVADQRPPQWRQWPEIAWKDETAPRFVGDLPHGWVASSFVRALRRMLVYERPTDDALVIGAGVPAAWIGSPSPIRLRALPTRYGPLTVTIRRLDGRRIAAEIDDLRAWPRGGVVLDLPNRAALVGVEFEGQAREIDSVSEIRVERGPARIVLEYRPGS